MEQNAAVLREAIFDQRGQLHLSSHSVGEDDRELEHADAGEFSFRAESAAEDYALVEAARLRGYARILLQRHFRAWRPTRPGLVSTSAELQERRRCLEFFHGRAAIDAGGV